MKPTLFARLRLTALCCSLAVFAALLSVGCMSEAHEAKPVSSSKVPSSSAKKTSAPKGKINAEVDVTDNTEE